MNDTQILGSIDERAHTTADEVVRLESSNGSHWQHLPRFIERSIHFAQETLSYNDIQIRNFEQDLKNRWVTPNGALMLAIFDGHGIMVGHILGWINVDYGQPYLFNFQADVDEGYDLRPIVNRVFEEHVEYIGHMNAMYEQMKQDVRINKVITQTMRNGPALVRYLEMKGITAILERAVISWKVE